MNCNKTKTTAQTTNDQQCQKGMTTTNKMRTMTRESKNTVKAKTQNQHKSDARTHDEQNSTTIYDQSQFCEREFTKLAAAPSAV
jgi:hypothetical protein